MTRVDSLSSADLEKSFIYLRVSTKRQARTGDEPEGYIPAPREICTQKAEGLGAEVVEEFVDAGASARSADRPELQRMLTELKRRKRYQVRHRAQG